MQLINQVGRYPKFDQEVCTNTDLVQKLMERIYKH